MSRRWPTWKRDLYAKLWNEGTPSAALRERFGVRNPGSVAKSLRAAGYVMAQRGPKRPRKRPRKAS